MVMTAIMDDWTDLPAGQDVSLDSKVQLHRDLNYIKLTGCIGASKVTKISKDVVIVHWKRNDLSGNDWEVINSDPDLDGTDEWTVVEG